LEINEFVMMTFHVENGELENVRVGSERIFMI
jgi:hypothetical protein